MATSMTHAADVMRALYEPRVGDVVSFSLLRSGSAHVDNFGFIHTNTQQPSSIDGVLIGTVTYVGGTYGIPWVRIEHGNPQGYYFDMLVSSVTPQ